MNEQEKYEYWLSFAQEDLKTAEAMIKTKRWLYVTFCCQQAIEKLVKALYGLYLGFDSIPRVHNITRIVNDFANKLPQPVKQEYFDLFDLLTRYYLNNRYPDYVEQLSGQAKEGNSRDIFAQTKEAFTWLLTMRP
jgi:HEPN domain-containing protein